MQFPISFHRCLLPCPSDSNEAKEKVRSQWHPTREGRTLERPGQWPQRVKGQARGGHARGPFGFGVCVAWLKSEVLCVAWWKWNSLYLECKKDLRNRSHKYFFIAIHMHFDFEMCSPHLSKTPWIRFALFKQEQQLPFKKTSLHANTFSSLPALFHWRKRGKLPCGWGARWRRRPPRPSPPTASPRFESWRSSAQSKEGNIVTSKKRDEIHTNRALILPFRKPSPTYT